MKFKGRLERRRPGAVRIFNRIAKVASGGLEYEADLRLAEILMKDVGADEASKRVVTPWSNGERGQDVKGDKSESRFGAVTARGNCLGQDRMDMQCTAKEISRSAPKPEEKDSRAAKRLARYLKDHRRVVLERKYQQLPTKVAVWSGADFA